MKHKFAFNAWAVSKSFRFMQLIFYEPSFSRSEDIWLHFHYHKSFLSAFISSLFWLQFHQIIYHFVGAAVYLLPPKLPQLRGPFIVIVIILYIFVDPSFVIVIVVFLLRWKSGVQHINKSLKCVHFVIETHSSHGNHDDDDDDDVVALGLFVDLFSAYFLWSFEQRTTTTMLPSNLW